MSRRRLLIVAVPALAVLLALSAACWVLFVDPRRDPASPADPADAILALGGSPDTAYEADRLFRAGFARHLVLADPYEKGYSQIGSLCPVAPASPAPGVTCFRPVPSKTRGEAREIGRLARQNGWNNVIVVAPTFQISRARYIVGRCYTGRLRMVDARIAMSVKLWLFEIPYQAAASVKARAQDGC